MRYTAPLEDLDAYVEVELLASAPYVDFVYGDTAVARRIHRRLVAASVGEFGSPFGILACDGTNPVGMIAGPLSRAELSKARMAAAKALIKDEDFAGDAAFRRRASAATPALVKLVEGDAYLSRIGVAPSARGRGTGSKLLQHFLELSRQRGATRAVLEVASVHGEALRMYERAGFKEFAVGVARDDDRVLEYHHLALPLA